MKVQRLQQEVQQLTLCPLSLSLLRKAELSGPIFQSCLLPHSPSRVTMARYLFQRLGDFPVSKNSNVETSESEKLRINVTKPHQLPSYLGLRSLFVGKRFERRKSGTKEVKGSEGRRKGMLVIRSQLRNFGDGLLMKRNDISEGRRRFLRMIEV